MCIELLPFKHSTDMTLAILSIAVVFIPHKHALSICGVQQRLRRHIKQGIHSTR